MSVILVLLRKWNAWYRILRYSKGMPQPFVLGRTKTTMDRGAT